MRPGADDVTVARTVTRVGQWCCLILAVSDFAEFIWKSWRTTTIYKLYLAKYFEDLEDLEDLEDHGDLIPVGWACSICPALP